ncbi:unnamed protein product [Triticum turgidum subsp. durum]|uniref:LOB domain-containing protein n=1 Tax=Triticum turgidum subsp. durum TaxID=4567 RepID=A0A9R0S6P5_TRITD|nr:unnamed protein product [Triticum turgidum subsp. durum]
MDYSNEATITAAAQPYGRSMSPPSRVSSCSPPPVFPLMGNAPSSPPTIVLSPCAACKDLPESSRADAVSSMVYEAEARLRDPVYGCAGTVCRLQKEANELKVDLARAQADLLSIQTQHANLLALVCVEFAANHRGDQQLHQPPPLGDQLNGIGGSGGGAMYQPLYNSDFDSAPWEEARQLWT